MNVRPLGFCLCLITALPGFIAPSVKAEDLPLSDPSPANIESTAIPARIESTAKAITVKVMAGNLWGSGIIIKRQNNVYTVLTNAHVAALGETYRIQTPDGRVYSGRLQVAEDMDGEDLAALSFSSSNSYQVANLAIPDRYAPGSSVFAAGFPAKSKFYARQGFTITNGKISTLLGRSMKGGYQLGYTNDIFKGMSGGPLLNELGEVIAVNGKHKFPLWGNTYFYKDGSSPNEMSRRSMDYLSWAIPMSSVSQKLPQLINAKASRLPLQGSAERSQLPQASESPQTFEDAPLGFNAPKKAVSPAPDLLQSPETGEDFFATSETRQGDRRSNYLFSAPASRSNRPYSSQTRTRKAW